MVFPAILAIEALYVIQTRRFARLAADLMNRVAPVRPDVQVASSASPRAIRARRRVKHVEDRDCPVVVLPVILAIEDPCVALIRWMRPRRFARLAVALENRVVAADELVSIQITLAVQEDAASGKAANFDVRMALNDHSDCNSIRPLARKMELARKVKLSAVFVVQALSACVTIVNLYGSQMNVVLRAWHVALILAIKTTRKRIVARSTQRPRRNLIASHRFPQRHVQLEQPILVSNSRWNR